jgi:hypothetical protein
MPSPNGRNMLPEVTIRVYRKDQNRSPGREPMEEKGYNGLRDPRKGRPAHVGWRWRPEKQFYGLYREKYYELERSHFYERSKRWKGIELSYTPSPPSKKTATRDAGMMLHMDGSKHRWFQDDRLLRPDHGTTRNWWRKNRPAP